MVRKMSVSCSSVECTAVRSDLNACDCIRITSTWFSSSIERNVFVIGPSTRRTCAAVVADCALGNGIRVVNTNGANVVDAAERRSEDMTFKKKDTNEYVC
jgi:hypothetical protein